MKTCTNCGAQVGHGDKFCTKCGAQIDNENKFCTNCGTPINGGDEFCAKCGAQISSLNTEPAQVKKNGVKWLVPVIAIGIIVLITMGISATPSEDAEKKSVGYEHVGAPKTEQDKATESQIIENNKEESSKSETATPRMELPAIYQFETDLKDAVVSIYREAGTENAYERCAPQDYTITEITDKEAVFDNMITCTYGPNKVVGLVANAKDGMVENVYTFIPIVGMELTGETLSYIAPLVMIPAELFNDRFTGYKSLYDFMQDIVQNGTKNASGDGASLVIDGVEYKLTITDTLISFNIDAKGAKPAAPAPKAEKPAEKMTPTSFYNKVKGFWCLKYDGNWEVLKFEDGKMNDFTYMGHFWMAEADIDKVETLSDGTLKVSVSYLPEYDPYEEDAPPKETREYKFRLNEGTKKSLTAINDKNEFVYDYVGETWDDMEIYLSQNGY